MASWQDLLREKTGVLHQAVQDWAQRKARGGSGFEFRGFLGSSVLNPVADAYELLVAWRSMSLEGFGLGRIAKNMKFQVGVQMSGYDQIYIYIYREGAI